MRPSRRISLGHRCTAAFLQRRSRPTVQPVVAGAEQLVLVVNAGSSSLKFKLFAHAAAGLRAEVSGLVERIGDVHASRMVVKRVMGAWPNCQECTIDHEIQVVRVLRMGSPCLNAVTTWALMQQPLHAQGMWLETNTAGQMVLFETCCVTVISMYCAHDGWTYTQSD